MTLFCFLLFSLFFCGCGIFFFLFTLLAPYNIYSFREANIYIINKKRGGRGGGLTVSICLEGNASLVLEAPCPEWLCIFVNASIFDSS